MEMNMYALEKQVEMRLREARAASAREALVASLRAGRSSRFSVLSALGALATGRWLLRRAARGHGARLATPVPR